MTRVASGAGIRYETLSRIMNGKEPCGFDTAVRLSMYLGFDDEIIPACEMRRRIAEKKAALTGTEPEQAPVKEPVRPGSPEETFLIDPVTKLRVPPILKTPYNGRSAVYGSKINPQEFIAKEHPGHAANFLLYSEFFREEDNSFYKACYYEAKQEGISTAEYMLRLGILSREHLKNPPKGLERQAALIRKVRLIGLAEGLRRSASKIDPRNEP